LPGKALSEPSFNCGGRLSSAETLICATPALADSDRQLAEAFARVLKGAPAVSQASIVQWQRQWLVERDADCGLSSHPGEALVMKDVGAAECLGRKYEKRLAAITDPASMAGLQTHDATFPAKRFAFLPLLTDSHDETLCGKFLAMLTDDFRSVDEAPLSLRASNFSMPGGAWVALPDENGMAVEEADLDENGKRSLIVYRSTSFFTGSGEGRDLRLWIQPIADRDLLPADIEAVDKHAADPGTPSNLVGVSPFEGGVKWPDMNPINIFAYGGRYYVFHYFGSPGLYGEPIVALRQLHGNGTASPVCKVQMLPQLETSDLKAGNAPQWLAFPPADGQRGFNKITLPTALLRFLGAIQRIQGEEGPNSGTLHALYRLQGQSAMINQKAVTQPWDLLTAPTDEFEVTETETALHQWAMASVSNFHLFEEYRIAEPMARQSLSTFYRENFDVLADLADKASAIVLDRIIASSFHFERSQAAPDAPRVALGDMATVAKISAFRHPPSTEAVSTDVTQLLESALLTGAGKEDIIYLLEHGAQVTNGDMEPYGSGEPTLFFALEHPALMDLMLHHGASVRAINNFGKTALMYAAQYDLAPTARLLLKRGADIAAKAGTPDGDAAYSLAIRCKDRTALMYAAENASATVIDLLLDAGANGADSDSCQHSVKIYLDRNVSISPGERAAIEKRLAR
jgi:uncharacterized protein YecT (DUF1311 family)